MSGNKLDDYSSIGNQPETKNQNTAAAQFTHPNTNCINHNLPSKFQIWNDKPGCQWAESNKILSTNHVQKHEIKGSFHFLSLLLNPWYHTAIRLNTIG